MRWVEWKQQPDYLPVDCYLGVYREGEVPNPVDPNDVINQVEVLFQNAIDEGKAGLKKCLNELIDSHDMADGRMTNVLMLQSGTIVYEECIVSIYSSLLEFISRNRDVAAIRHKLHMTLYIWVNESLLYRAINVNHNLFQQAIAAYQREAKSEMIMGGGGDLASDAFRRAIKLIDGNWDGMVSWYRVQEGSHE